MKKGFVIWALCIGFYGITFMLAQNIYGVAMGGDITVSYNLYGEMWIEVFLHSLFFIIFTIGFIIYLKEYFNAT